MFALQGWIATKNIWFSSREIASSLYILNSVRLPMSLGHAWNELIIYIHLRFLTSFVGSGHLVYMTSLHTIVSSALT